MLRNAIIAICVAGLCVSPAVAAGPQDADVAALARRLEQLELENSALKKRFDALERTNTSLRKQLGAAGASQKASPGNNASVRVTNALGAPQNANLASAPAAAPPALEATGPRWSGVYLGGSFGGAFTKSSISSAENFREIVPTNTPPFQVFGQSTLATSSQSGGRGALLDAYVGANTVFNGFFLAGVQFEGTLSDVSFNSTGTRTVAVSNAAGLTGQVAVISSWQPQVHARWMTSALVRAGVLVQPETLLYAIGGWTGAQFEYGMLTDNLFLETGQTFWASGATLGGGLEHKFGQNWSLRAEYRYTRFRERDVNNSFSAVDTNPSFTETNMIHSTFRNSMQVGRMGAAYLLPPIW